MPSILFTGFPGFLGSRLLPRLLERFPGHRAVCLVQARFADLARQRVRELARDEGLDGGSVDLVEGDITVPGLALERPRMLAGEVEQIVHLAALYDLSARREPSLKINLAGTSHVLDFAESCRGLRRLHYASTCYVSGRYAGIFGEEDLDRGQSFNNYYEETKFLAEDEVQGRMRGGLPATIYRPSIVVGDSRSGATQKFDGPYFVMQWLLRQPHLALMPVVGDPSAYRVNVVPVDFIIDAVTHLSALEESRGVVYQLADPEPLTVEELLDAMAEATGKRVIRVPSMRWAAKAALDWVPGVYRVMRIPSAAVDYFVHPTHYTTRNTRAHLESTGIAVPPITSYLDRLVEFVREHPEIGTQAMA